MKTRVYKGILVNQWFMGLPEIQDLICHSGSAGLGRLMVLAVQLLNCDNTIGTDDDLGMVCKMLNCRMPTMRKMIADSSIFNCAEKDGKTYFVIKNLRLAFKLEVEIQPEELDVISKIGNKSKILSKMGLAKIKKNAALTTQPEPDKTPAGKQPDASKQTADEITKSQGTDNEDDTASPIYSNINENKNVHYIANNNVNVNEHTSTMSASGGVTGGGEGEVINFLEKKLKPCTQWRKSTSHARMINLEDDSVLHAFAEWMHDYCISNSTMPHGIKNMQRYASNLLARKNSTRRDFEKYLQNVAGIGARAKTNGEDDEKPVFVPRPREKVCYEQLIDGRRVGLDGQILPKHAPRQCDFQMRWSYILDKYVSVLHWDQRREEVARFEFERKQKKMSDARYGAIYDDWSRRQCDAEKDDNGDNGDNSDNSDSLGNIINKKILPDLKKPDLKKPDLKKPDLKKPE